MNLPPQTVVYTIIRTVAALLTLLGVANFTDAETEAVVAWAAGVYVLADLTVKVWAALRKAF